jgi:hypothetical protein
MVFIETNQSEINCCHACMADQSHSLILCFEARLSISRRLDSFHSKVKNIILVKGIRWCHF